MLENRIVTVVLCLVNGYFCRYTKGDKTYEQILLRESYREPGAKRSAVKKRTLLNFTKYPPKLICAIEPALKHKEDLSALTSLKEVNIEQGQSVGGVFTLLQSDSLDDQKGHLSVGAFRPTPV
jgi:hypothetical protein